MIWMRPFVADYDMCESLYMYVLVPRTDRVMMRRGQVEVKVNIFRDRELRAV